MHRTIPRGRKEATPNQVDYLQTLLGVSTLPLERVLERMREDVDVDVKHDPVRGLCAGQAYAVTDYLKKYCNAFKPMRQKKSTKDA